MTLLAPTASLTDLLLAITALALAWFCFDHSRRTGTGRSRWWSVGYAALGVGALLGFVNLGFQPQALQRAIYLLSRLSTGAAVLAMLTAVVEALASPLAARRWRLLLISAFLAYYGASLFNSSFLIFIAYSGTALLATLALESYRWLRLGQPGAAWMASGMALSIIAAVLQAAKLSFTLVWHFDHNAIYHMVQTVALLVLYRGVTSGAALPAPGQAQSA